MDLSIIIPSYNTKDLLDRCISSVIESFLTGKMSYEIIVVDNASEDGSRELLNNKYPRVIKILNKENIGYGKANNQGIRKARGKRILLLNSDIQVIDKAIEQLVEFAQKKSNCFFGGKLLNEDQSPQPSCGPMYSLPVVFAMLFCKGDLLGITRYSPKEVKFVDWVSGACLLGSKSAFLDTGLFDEDIFLYMEDIDFLYRAKQKGYTVMFIPTSRFIHKGAASSGNRKTPVVHIYRGLIYFYHKHRGKIPQMVLRSMLSIKAYAGIILGRMIGRNDVVQIYETALSMV